MTATSGGSAKTHLEDGIKALESGDKEGAMTQLTAAQQAMQGSSPDAIMHFKEGMKALEGGDSNGPLCKAHIIIIAPMISGIPIPYNGNRTTPPIRIKIAIK